MSSLIATMGYNKGELVNLLRVIFQNTHQNIDWDVHKANKVLMGGGTRISFKGEKGEFEGLVPDGEGPTLVILNDGINAFNKFVIEVMKDDEFKKYIAPKAIESKLESVLRKTQGKLPETDISEFLKLEILKPLREEIRPWISYVPIDNLIVKNNLKIGDVVFLPKEVVKNELNDFLSKHQYAGTIDEQNEQREGVNTVLDHFFKNYNSYAKVTVRAHATKGSQKSIEIAYVAINALRTFTHILYSPTLKSYFGLPNEIQRGTWLTVLYGNDKNKGFTIDFHQRQSLAIFVIDETNINKLNKYCYFQKIQQILATPPDKRRDIENIIIQTLQAIGNSVVSPTIDMKFLNCTIALERLLIADGEETTTERFTDRLTLLLSNDLKARLRIREKAKDLYNKRSKIVHAAFFGVEEEDYRLFENWAIGILVHILKNYSKYKSHRDFCNAIDDLKYGKV
jgi:hypothetical protein